MSANLLAKVTPLNLRVVAGKHGEHVEGRAVARVVAEVQAGREPGGGRCVVYVFGERREEIAQLIALAADHALVNAAMTARKIELGDIMEFNGERSVSVALGNVITVLYLDAFGCPAIPPGDAGDRVRAALRAALGLKP